MTGAELATFTSPTAPRPGSSPWPDTTLSPYEVGPRWPGLGDENLRTGIEAAHEAAIATSRPTWKTTRHPCPPWPRRRRADRHQKAWWPRVPARPTRVTATRTSTITSWAANRVKGADGKWSTLDGGTIYQ
ncbi:hypothetical protein QJS66_23655 (plasmid) [Kocuria rhizophila]|nr:hypothetical protein QJS66_23655 [Kocuria rhizophila]